MVEDIAVGREDAVGEPVVAHELPDVLDRVQFRIKDFVIRASIVRRRKSANAGWMRILEAVERLIVIADEQRCQAAGDAGADAL